MNEVSTTPTHDLILSVVICTYNREKFLPGVLLCLAGQSLDRSLFEIIVIDNNSTDNTKFHTLHFIDQYPGIDARYVHEPQQGLSFARNRGIAEARGNVIIYLDDDAEPVPGYLEEIYGFYAAHPRAVGIGGQVQPRYAGGKEPQWMNKYLAGFVGLTNYGPEVKKFDDSMKYPTGCNMSYRKEILVRSGGFNNQLKFRSDDKHIFHEVARLSHEVYYLPHALVYHHIDDKRLEFDSFRKLYLKTGNEEKIRVSTEGGSGASIRKGMEFFAKLIASFGLYLIYLLKGHEMKGRYIVLSQWYTLKGFFMKEVFVR
jgi:glycosyltransferase involved in cell wall biosynthesis